VYYEKIVLFLFLSIIVISLGTILFYGCTKDFGDYETAEYVLLINIKTPDGIDVLKEIPVTERAVMVVEDKDGWSRRVNPELYRLHQTQPEEYSKTPSLPLCVNKINDNYYLVIQFVDNVCLEHYYQATFKLICSNIFGDDEEHTIVTYWNPNGSYRPKGDYPRMECDRITIDGIQYPVNQELFIPNFSDEMKKLIAPNHKEDDYYRFISVAKIVL
jgi:hypothetical protein